MKTLPQGIQDYLTLRRALGFQFNHVEAILKQFVSFLQENGAPRMSPELMIEWAKRPVHSQSAHWAKRLGIVRDFAQYWKSIDPQVDLPAPGVLPYRYRRATPYIYQETEIKSLLQASSFLQPKDGLRRHTYFTLIGLIAVAGLRIREPIALNREDVDFSQGIITVRKSKFGKSRLVPLDVSTVKQLRRYAQIRDRLHSELRTPAFFVSDRGTRVTKDSVRWAFIEMSKRSGLRKPSDRRGPRIHDLRHSFAVRTLLDWYRAGFNIDQHMPVLSTYLGHDHPSDTYWYLSAVPELFAIAGAYLEKHMGGVL